MSWSRSCILGLTILWLSGIEPEPVLALGFVEVQEDRLALEFFEKSVRPILVDRCVSCHGPEEQKGGLRLDSKAEALEVGGASGPAIVPGDLDESFLIEAIGYESFVQMPPRSKLPDEEIQVLTRWVENGAPWPDLPETGSPSTGPSSDPNPFDLQARKAAHWSFQTVRQPPIPEVNNTNWPQNPIDHFLLATLESHGLTPAPEADRRTLLRRASFSLTGLPPTIEELEQFLADESPDAFGKAVDRMLDSPHYGERWGRHWLDLMRFAETSGHEFDYDIIAAWQYRDYVVRAFNIDLPFDQFLIEHVAGDLLEEPRRHPTEGTNESILATAFFFLAEGTHSPVNVEEDMRDRVDNQIDVLGKAFLGLTVACARCHDHKFDPISTADYYALAGYLQSTRHQYETIDPPSKIKDRLKELESLRQEISSHLDVVLVKQASAAEIADPSKLELFESFEAPGYAGWFVSGDAFGDGPTEVGEVLLQALEDGQTVVPLNPGWADSGRVSDKLVGVLRSRTFKIEKPYIHYWAIGRGGRINVVVENFEKIRSPIYDGLTVGVDREDEPGWVTQNVQMWIGHHAYLELSDGGTANYTTGKTHLWPGDGFLAVDSIWFSEDRSPPFRSGPPLLGEPIEPSAELADRIEQFRQVEQQIPEPTLALTAADGSVLDVRPSRSKGPGISAGHSRSQRCSSCTNDRLYRNTPQHEFAQVIFSRLLGLVDKI